MTGSALSLHRTITDQHTQAASGIRKAEPRSSGSSALSVEGLHAGNGCRPRLWMQSSPMCALGRRGRRGSELIASVRWLTARWRIISGPVEQFRFSGNVVRAARAC